MAQTLDALAFKNLNAKIEVEVLSGTVAYQPPPQALRFSQGRGERLVMNRKGPWEGYRRHIFIERETSGYEAGSLRGRRSKGKGKGNWARDRERGRREEGNFLCARNPLSLPFRTPAA